MNEQEITRLTVQIQPGARRNEVVSVSDESIVRIKISAPPVEGKANEALLDFLRKVLEIRKSQISLILGEKSRMKVVQVSGMNLQQMLSKLKDFSS